MIRRFNYTGRRRISRSRVSISISRPGEGDAQFDARIALAGLGLPGDAHVFVEAYYRSSWMRFDHGLISRMTRPADTRLTELDPSSVIYFRVKVVDESGTKGLILASVDRIRPPLPGEESANKRSILPVATMPLGQEICRVNIEAGGPLLEVNKDIPDVLGRVARDPLFFSLVYPAVLRQILIRAIFVERPDDPSNPGGWQGRWIEFARSLCPAEVSTFDAEEEEEGALLGWIDDVVSAFCRRFEVKDRFMRASTPPEG